MKSKIFINLMLMSLLFSQDTTFISLPNPHVDQTYFNNQTIVNMDCNGCFCATGEPIYLTEIIQYPNWLDSIYISFEGDSMNYIGGVYKLNIIGNPTTEDIGLNTIELHEFVSYDLFYTNEPTWFFTDVYYLHLYIENPLQEIGDECTHWSGESGYLNCLLDCIPAEYFTNWLGDGICDYEFVEFDCPEFGFDCGDCNPDLDGTDPLGFCEEECNSNIGDINEDGEINVQDVIMGVNFIIGCYPLDECQTYLTDVNEDYFFNILDIILIVFMILDE